MASKLTDEDRIVLEKVNSKLKPEMEWFYSEVKKLRSLKESKVRELIELATNDIKTRGGSDGLYLLKDICTVFKWEKGTHKELRNRLGKLQTLLCNSRGVTSDEINKMLFNALKRGYEKDYDDSTDLLLTEKEVKYAKKRRKKEKNGGLSKVSQIKVPLTPEQKKEKNKQKRLEKKAEGEALKAQEDKISEKKRRAKERRLARKAKQKEE
jgi:hypothetical protein